MQIHSGDDARRPVVRLSSSADKRLEVSAKARYRRFVGICERSLTSKYAAPTKEKDGLG